MCCGLCVCACVPTRWIIAKYRWYGFVGDDKRDPPLVSKALIHVSVVHWMRLVRAAGLFWKGPFLVYLYADSRCFALARRRVRMHDFVVSRG